MKVGYIQINANDESANNHIEIFRTTLSRQDCNFVFIDKVTDLKSERTEWKRCWKFLQEEDELIVRSVLHIGNNFNELLSCLGEIVKRKIKVKSLVEPMVNNTASGGELDFSVIAQIAEWQKYYESKNGEEQVDLVSENGEIFLTYTPATISAKTETPESKKQLTLVRPAKKRRRHPRRYPLKTIHQVVEDIQNNPDKPISQIAKEFGVSEASCYLWNKKYKTSR